VDSTQLNSVKKSVQDINPLAEVIESEFCNLDPDLLFSNYGTDRGLKDHKPAGLTGAGPPTINARVFKTGRTISLFVLLDDHSIVSVQTVFEKIDISRIEDKTGNTALILMGEDFNLSEFSRDFRQLTE
jgi:hypothetical protein